MDLRHGTQATGEDLGTRDIDAVEPEGGYWRCHAGADANAQATRRRPLDDEMGRS
jgi:hypothetical protein